jgi:hypothetical protein
LSNYRYILEPYKGMNTRYNCPKCEGKKTFVRYIDIETGKHFAANVGRCNRESNCSYHYTPKQYFRDTKQIYIPPQHGQPKQNTITTLKPLSFIPDKIFKDSLKKYDANNFVTYLRKIFGAETTKLLSQTYNIGTSKHWHGATVFWQIDRENNIRTGKIMLYNSDTGKRIKKPYNYITWVHSLFNLQNCKQCFFGEHLLEKEPLKIVAIVESEKTAIIASVYLPEFVWLAVGGLSNLTPEKCKVLQGRNVILFPDLKCFDKWQQKANELSNIATFKISDLLERRASEAEKLQGLDLADYFEYRLAKMPCLLK